MQQHREVSTESAYPGSFRICAHVFSHLCIILLLQPACNIFIRFALLVARGWPYSCWWLGTDWSLSGGRSSPCNQSKLDCQY